MNIFATVTVIALAVASVPVETGCNANGTPTPQTQQEIQDSAALGLCVEGVIAKDGAATPPASVAQVAIDEATTCASYALKVLADFGSDSTTANQAAVLEKAHASVMLNKAAGH